MKKKLHDKYVLVPADKASNNVVVICKHYIEVIIKELVDVTCSKSTYQYVTDNPTSIIHRHIKYMKEINLVVPSNMEELPCGCPSCIKLLLAQGLLLTRIGVQ